MNVKLAVIAQVCLNFMLPYGQTIHEWELRSAPCPNIFSATLSRFPSLNRPQKLVVSIYMELSSAEPSQIRFQGDQSHVSGTHGIDKTPQNILLDSRFTVPSINRHI